METKRYKLKDILSIGNGKDHSSLGVGEYPVYGSGGYMKSVDSFLYDGESVLLPRKGTLSNIQYVYGKFWTVDTCYYTKIDTSLANPYYLYCLLRSYDLSGLDSGASIPSMTSKTYYGVKVELPSLDIQDRITTILKQYDSLIESNNSRIKVLEKMAENLYKEWFVRFRFPGHESAEFENGIPKAWGYVKLGEAVTFIDGDRGSNYPTQDEFSEDGYCLFLNAGNVTKSGFDFTNCSYITKEKDTLLKKGKLNNGDVVLTTRGTVGNSAFYNTKIKNKNVRINSGMVIIRGKELLSSEYIYTLLNDDYIKAMISLYSSGSAQPQLPIKDLKRIRIMMPDEKTMKQFTELVKKIYDEISIVNMCNLSIIKQRDLLLPRLMSGKLEV